MSMFLRDNTAGLIKGFSGFPKGKNGLLFKKGGNGLPQNSQFGFKGNWAAHKTLFADDDDVNNKTVDEKIVDGDVVETVVANGGDKTPDKEAFNVIGNNNEVGDTIQEQIVEEKYEKEGKEEEEEGEEDVEQLLDSPFLNLFLNKGNKVGFRDGGPFPQPQIIDLDAEQESFQIFKSRQQDLIPSPSKTEPLLWTQTKLQDTIKSFNTKHGYKEGDYGYILQGIPSNRQDGMNTVDAMTKAYDDGILHHAIRTKGDLSKYSTDQINEGKEYIKHELDDGLIMILTYDFAKEQNDELGDTYKALTTLANDLEEARTGKKVSDTQSPFHIKRGGKGSDKDKINRIRKNISDYVEKERVKLNAMNADEERKKRDETIRNEANKLKAADTKAFIESIEKRLKALDEPPTAVASPLKV